MRDELNAVLGEIRKAIVGKDEVIGKILTAMLAEGHILLDDVPGVGKTTLAVALSRAMDLTYHRILHLPSRDPERREPAARGRDQPDFQQDPVRAA